MIPFRLGRVHPIPPQAEESLSAAVVDLFESLSLSSLSSLLEAKLSTAASEDQSEVAADRRNYGSPPPIRK